MSLVPEFTVFGFGEEAGTSKTVFAISGIADALTRSSDGKIEAIVDWKSDVNPTKAIRENYKSQIRDYMEATEATRGLIVYMSLGQVDENAHG